MDRKKLVLLLGALVIAIGTALAARSLLSGSTTPQAIAATEPQGTKVLVAQRGLPVGTIITAEAMSYQPWPEELVQDAYFIDGESDISQLMGTVVRHPITAGQPVTQGALVSPNDRGFLAAALGAGMRAVTIPVSAQTGVAGFVFPGDRVDLVLTGDVTIADIELEGDKPLKSAETVMTNVRVLATDQRAIQETDENGQTVAKTFNLVTLEVTPKIAEKVAVAKEMGTITLALRSIADNQAELDKAIASGKVKIPENATPEEEAQLLSKALQPSSSAKSYSTSMDVSELSRRRVAQSYKKKAELEAEEAAKRAKEEAAARAAAEVVPGYTGPSIRVLRGKAITDVPVDDAKENASAAASTENLGK